MKQYLHKGAFKNLSLVLTGVFLFYLSFHIGEDTALGGIMHLLGCSLVCMGVHSRWCRQICDDEHECK